MCTRKYSRARARVCVLLCVFALFAVGFCSKVCFVSLLLLMFVAYPSMLASWFEKSSLIGWSLKGKKGTPPITDSVSACLAQPVSEYAPNVTPPLDYQQFKRRKEQRLMDNDADSWSDSSSDLSSQLSGYDPSMSSGGSDFEYFTAMSSQSQSDNEERQNGGSFSSLSDIEVDPGLKAKAKPGTAWDSDLEYITAASYSSFSEYETSSLKSGSYYTALDYAGPPRSRPASWASDLEYETARSHLSSSTSDCDLDWDETTPTPKVKLPHDSKFRYPVHVPANDSSGSKNNNNNSPGSRGDAFTTKYQTGYSGYTDSDLTPSGRRYQRGLFPKSSGPEYSTAVSDLSDFEDGRRGFSSMRAKLHMSGKAPFELFHPHF